MIDAPYGHDCFLLEEARQTPMIQQFLARTGNGRLSQAGFRPAVLADLKSALLSVAMV